MTNDDKPPSKTSALDTSALDELAERVFAAFVDHDLDAVEAMMVPGATLTQNGRVSSFAEARPMLESLRSVIGDHRYENVRRTIGTKAVVEEHDVVSTTPAGKAIRLAACVVIRVDDDGMITALDEYVDGSSLRR